MLKKILLVLILGLWPLNLYLNNTPENFLNYTLPAFLVAASYFLKTKNVSYYYLPLLLTGFLSPKLAPVPVLFLVIETFRSKSPKLLLPLIVSVAVFFALFKPFYGQTVFIKDYEAQQLILRNIQLYPNPYLARLFQNKAKIYSDKVISNFFTLTDPNNYFFALHPRPISIDNQNLYKYPFASLIFFMVGIYYFKKFKQNSFVVNIFLSSLLCLALLKNFDRNDFVLYVPVSIFIYHGVFVLETINKNVYRLAAFSLIIFAIPEFLRSYVEKIL